VTDVDGGAASAGSLDSLSRSDHKHGFSVSLPLAAICDQGNQSNTDILPGDHKTYNLGASDEAWDDGYADDWNNVADFPFFDEKDDLAAILGIKSSGVRAPEGYLLIDDDSLPEWLLKRNRKTLAIEKTKDGKPFIPLKHGIGLAWGGIRQLVGRLEREAARRIELEQRIAKLEASIN